MSNFIYYSPAVVTRARDTHIDIKRFTGYFQIYHVHVVPIDRTGTIRFPINASSLFPLPAFRPMTRSFEDLCNERATELLLKAETLSVPIYVFYSGGIDSTLVMVSLLKNASSAQRKNITVLLSEDSIRENPNFYKDHLHGKISLESSNSFSYLIGRDALFINGEHNDQLFGSDVVISLMQKYGTDAVLGKYSRRLYYDYFENRLENKNDAIFYVDLFERLVRAAPVPIHTNYEYAWWINFAVKWQTVSLRSLPYVAERNVAKISKTYFENNIVPFYRTDDFQLWSMNNLDKKIKNTWESYKWICKDIIFDFTKDADYRNNKIKIGSLYNVLLGRQSYAFIDEFFNFSHDIPFEQYYNSDNDFI